MTPSERSVVRVRGRRYLTLDWVADCYQVEEQWVVDVCRTGALGESLEVGGRLAVPEEMLDRLAALWRLCHHLGLDLDTAVVWIDLAMPPQA